MTALATLFSLLLAANAAAPSDPKSITDFYQLLANGKKVPAAAVSRDGRWSYTAQIDGEDNAAKGQPLIDLKNGYMRLDYGAGEPTVHTEIVLFTAANSRKLVGVADTGTAGDAEQSGVQFFEFSGPAFRDVSKQMGALSTLGPADFLEESYLQSKQAAADKPNEQAGLLLIEIALPRQGTSVVATLKLADDPPPVDDGDKQLAAAGKLLRDHRKYSSIELAWSKATGTFSLAKKNLAAEAGGHR